MSSRSTVERVRYIEEALGKAARGGLAQVAELKRALEDRVERAIAGADTGVIVAGRCVERICAEAMAAAAEVRQTSVTLAGGTDEHGVGALAARQTAHVEAFVTDMRRLMAMQATTTREAVTHSATIVDAGARVTEIAASSRMLALNAQIEAARLGAAGAGFAVIAAEMNELSKEVGRANGVISELAASLSRTLPVLLRNSEVLEARASTFSAELGADIRQMEEASARAETAFRGAATVNEARLTRIREASNEALSALQFHDPMVQHLRQLPSFVDELARRIERVLAADGADTQLPPLESAVRQHVAVAGRHPPEAGVVTLF
jgi:methyl-accepting chemotaxis protein